MTLTQLYPSKIQGPLVTEFWAEFSISNPPINESMVTASFEPMDPSGKPAQLQAASKHSSHARLLGSTGSAHIGNSPPASNTAKLAAKRNRTTHSASARERTSSHGLKLQRGRFRLGIRQSLLTGRIIKRRNRLPGEGQELPSWRFYKWWETSVTLTPLWVGGGLGSYSNTRLCFLTTPRTPHWSPTLNCSDPGADNSTEINFV